VGEEERERERRGTWAGNKVIALGFGPWAKGPVYSVSSARVPQQIFRGENLTTGSDLMMTRDENQVGRASCGNLCCRTSFYSILHYPLID